MRASPSLPAGPSPALGREAQQQLEAAHLAAQLEQEMSGLADALEADKVLQDDAEERLAAEVEARVALERQLEAARAEAAQAKAESAASAKQALSDLRSHQQAAMVLAACHSAGHSCYPTL